MFDRILRYGFIVAIVFITYSAGVIVNMYHVWPNSLYMNILYDADGA